MRPSSYTTKEEKFKKSRASVGYKLDSINSNIKGERKNNKKNKHYIVRSI